MREEEEEGGYMEEVRVILACFISWDGDEQRILVICAVLLGQDFGGLLRDVTRACSTPEVRNKTNVKRPGLSQLKSEELSKQTLCRSRSPAAVPATLL